MTSKSVLFVGLPDEQASQIELPHDVETTRVQGCDEALDFISLTPPTLIVASHTIEGRDSLDFFTRLMAAGTGSLAPVVFMAPADQSGAESFVYRRQRVGFEVRYLDREGDVKTHFIASADGGKDYAVRALRAERLGDQIVELLQDGGETMAQQTEDQDLRVMDIGFNQVVTFDGSDYHVQTEVIEQEPLTVATSVFTSGRAVHSDEQELEAADVSAVQVRSQVEKIHCRLVGRVSAGELR